MSRGPAAHPRRERQSTCWCTTTDSIVAVTHSDQPLSAVPDTDYNDESFFVRHAYFLGANDPYKALRTTLKAGIDADTWGTLHSDTSRPFDRPQSGRVAVKVINHLGDEVMRVFAARGQGGRRREVRSWIAGMKEESQARAEDPGATREVEGVLC